MEPICRGLATAQYLFQKNHLIEAEAAYRRLLDQPEQRAEAFYGLGVIEYKRDELEAAAKMFAASLVANPLGQNPLFYLGLIAARQGKKETAIQIYAYILFSNPKHVGALHYLSSYAPLPGPNQEVGDHE